MYKWVCHHATPVMQVKHIFLNHLDFKVFLIFIPDIIYLIVYVLILIESIKDCYKSVSVSAERKGIKSFYISCT